MPIYSLQIEKHVLGGLIRNQEIFADIDVFVNEHDFFHEVHGTIYCVIKNILSKGEKIDKVLLSQKIKDLGITFKDDINIFDYIEAISLTQITAKATIKACQELVKIRIRREIEGTAIKICEFIKTPGEKSLNEIISTADAMYNEKISMYALDEAPQNIFEEAEYIIEKIGENPTEEIGLKTPYPEYNRLYGGYKNGQIYAVVSRTGEGKSSFLVETVFHTGLINKIPTLYLDTEMSIFDVRIRMIAAMTGVPANYIERGTWRKNIEMTKLVRAAWPIIKKYGFDHYQVKGKPIDEILSIIRRWKMSKIGRNGQCLICYDYLKLTGEAISKGFLETQVVGDKVDKLKNVAEEIHAPLLTAMQMNRSGENKGKHSKDLTDDSTAIALSDRLLWFAANVGILRTKTIDELAHDGDSFGTHLYKNLKCRFQGADAKGHNQYVKTIDDHGDVKYVRDYINYDITNFKVEEKGSLRHVIEFKNNQFNVQDNKDGNDGDLI